MISGQLGKITGVPVHGETFVAELLSFAAGIGRVHLPTLLLAAAVLTFLLVGARLVPRAPIPLLAVLLAAGATALLSADVLGVRVVGAVPQGIPIPALPSVKITDLTGLLLPAIGVAIVAYSDNVLTGRAFATRNKHPLDADQEMLALGAANVAAGLLQGFPVSRRQPDRHRRIARQPQPTLLDRHAVTRRHGAVRRHVLFVGGPVLATFPTAALGALVVYAALRLIEPAEFRRFARFRRSELALAVATTIAVLVLGVLYGVLAAVGLSILDLLRRVSRPHAAVLGFVPGLAGMHDVDDHPGTTTVPGLVVYRYDAPLCFANAEDFRNRALAALDGAECSVLWLVLNAEAIVEIDITAADAVRSLCDELDARGVVLALARVKQDLLHDLHHSGLVERIGAEKIFPTLPTAVAAFENRGRPPSA